MATGVELVGFDEKDRQQWKNFHGVKSCLFVKVGSHTTDYLKKKKMLLYTVSGKILTTKKAQVQKKRASVFFPL